MQSKEQDNLVFIRLFPGENIYSELEKACRRHSVTTCTVISGIGQLRKFELGYLKSKGDYAPQVFTGAHELLSLSGIISEQAGEFHFHLHAILGDEKKNVIGGHLIRGEVSVTNEIVILKANLPVARWLEESSGLQGLFLD